MYEATLRIDEHSPYTEATRNSDTHIELWCNDHCDLLHVSGSNGSALDHVEATVGVRDDIAVDDDRIVITGDCLKEHRETVEGYLERHDCLLFPPITYSNGEKQFRVLALTPENLTAVYRDLAADHDVTVSEKHELPTLPGKAQIFSMDSVVPSLTARQRDVLCVAHRSGYYQIPRETTTEEIAGTFGLDRRTVEEHLRRAENKILGALVDQGVV